jgi:hypothetical protein
VRGQSDSFPTGAQRARNAALGSRGDDDGYNFEPVRGQSGSRNVVDPATAEDNRTGRPGGYTFNAFIPSKYAGIGFTVACVRLGDHAHLDIFSGRHVTRFHGSDPAFGGRAGRLVLRWPVWIKLRDEVLEPHPFIRIAEVENPTQGQLERHAGETAGL